jgi:hypothetical protein
MHKSLNAGPQIKCLGGRQDAKSSLLEVDLSPMTQMRNRTLEVGLKCISKVGA